MSNRPLPIRFGLLRLSLLLAGGVLAVSTLRADVPGVSAAPMATPAGAAPPLQAPLLTVDRAEFPNFDSAAFSLLSTGLTAKSTARKLAEAPDAPETARALASQARLNEALAVLRRIVEKHSDRIAEAFGQLSVFEFQRDATRPQTQPLLDLVAQARRRLPALPREDQAVAARALMSIENQLNRGGSVGWATALRGFVAEYAGTEAALLAEVDVINTTPLNAAQLEAFEAFARRHPGTAAAAKAIFEMGFDLAHNATALRIEPRGADPTPRFNRVVDIVRELESGKYPKCEWVDRAPTLISGFSMYNPTFSSPANIDAVLQTYRDFVRHELPHDALNLPGSTLDFVITTRMGDLHALKGDRIGGVERELDGFEKISPSPAAVRMLRAQYYLRQIIEIPAERASLISKAIATLEALRAEKIEPFSRRALATLASIQFHQRSYAAAAPLYEQYLSQHPRAEWAWVASIRLGQARMAAGDAASAAATYQTLAARTDLLPFVRVLGHAFAAEALASLGRVGDAARHAEQALAGWDDDHGLQYRTQAQQARRPGDEAFALPDDTTVVKASLPARIAELREAASLPGGAALERGRALIRQGQLAEARILLDRAGSDSRGTALEPAARSLSHRAWLEQALALADVESPSRDESAALRELERLGAEPLDFHVFAAQMTRATLLSSLRDGSAEAGALMSAAFATWRDRQPRTAPPPAGSLEADLLAIRTAVFTPLGGGVYDRGRWNAFSFPASLPRFMIVNPTIEAKLADGRVLRSTLRRALTGFDDVLFLDDGELSVLTSIMRALGGTGRRQPAQVMETPNQPAGRSQQVRELWNRFFPMRPGHWSGWEFETYPTITDVTFHDGERTRAAVRVTVGYSGGTVVLVKEQGTWRAVDLVGLWIT